MKQLLLFIFAPTLIVGAAYGVNVQLLSSSTMLPLPNADGSFSNISSEGHHIRHLYYIISYEDFITYTNAVSPSAAVFNDFLVDEIGEVCIHDETTEDGYSDIFLWDIFYRYDEVQDRDLYYDEYFPYETNACFAAIYIYTDETSGTTYYIAEPVSVFTGTRDEDENNLGIGVKILDIAINAGRWQVLYNEPPSITCTDLCVTGGVVSATYSISEFSRLNEVVSGEETSVIVAADLARTTQTNLAASVTATNSVDSTFTFSFNPAEQNWTNSTLFIFGVEPPR